VERCGGGSAVRAGIRRGGVAPQRLLEAVFAAAPAALSGGSNGRAQRSRRRENAVPLFSERVFIRAQICGVYGRHASCSTRNHQPKETSSMRLNKIVLCVTLTSMLALGAGCTAVPEADEASEGAIGNALAKGSRAITAPEKQNLERLLQPKGGKPRVTAAGWTIKGSWVPASAAKKSAKVDRKAAPGLKFLDEASGVVESPITPFGEALENGYSTSLDAAVFPDRPYAPLFTSADFAANYCFTYQGQQLCVQLGASGSGAVGGATSVKPYAKVFWINPGATTSFSVNMDQDTTTGTFNQRLVGPLWLQLKTDSNGDRSAAVVFSR
jgi:hypothetical protein